MISLLPLSLAALVCSPAAIPQSSGTIPVSVEYTGAGKSTPDKKMSLSITWTCGTGKGHQTAWETTYVHPDVRAWRLPGLRIHKIFLESGESRIEELSLIWKNPSSGGVRTVYSSVGGGNRELSFDWVDKPFSR